MRRGLFVILASLALAGSAAAALPVFSKGSSVGEGVPLKAYASITPTVHLFGDAVTAKIAVVADTKWIDPTRLRVNVDFTPYAATKTSVVRLQVGRFAQITWIWTLECTTSPCVPRVPPSEKFHIFRFRPAHVEYVRLDRKTAYGIDASWPAVEVLSQVSPGVAAFLRKTNRLNWRTGMTPVAAPSYRVSPTLLFWLAVGLAGLFAVAAVEAGRRWYVGVLRTAGAPPAPPGTALERAIAVLRYAHERGDETLQRKAFERVAGELGTNRAEELREVARELAWSPRTPHDQEVEDFAVRAVEPREEADR
jgi:hypothetical protein